MASYLIPKAARNVKLLLFKGLGLVEAVMFIVGVIVIVLVFNTKWDIAVQMLVATVFGLFVFFMISPSFIANKKGYESFKIIFNYWSSPKFFKKRVEKNKAV
jgi:hypothetical protein